MSLPEHFSTLKYLSTTGIEFFFNFQLQGPFICQHHKIVATEKLFYLFLFQVRERYAQVASEAKAAKFGQGVYDSS